MTRVATSARSFRPSSFPFAASRRRCSSLLVAARRCSSLARRCSSLKRNRVLPPLSVGEMTLRLYGAINYSQNNARDLRRALNGERKRLFCKGMRTHHQQ